MIFVTVGTHEQQFDRLVEFMDKWASEHDEEVIIQTGYSTYEPKCAKWKRMYSYNEMVNFVERARIVITHGGPSSFIMPLQTGKVPVVVPRKKEFGEHVNNHQVFFCNSVVQNRGGIICINDIKCLNEVISKYSNIAESTHRWTEGNSEKFCLKLSRIVNQLVLNESKV